MPQIQLQTTAKILLDYERRVNEALADENHKRAEELLEHLHDYLQQKALEFHTIWRSYQKHHKL